MEGGVGWRPLPFSQGSVPEGDLCLEPGCAAHERQPSAVSPGSQWRFLAQQRQLVRGGARRAGTSPMCIVLACRMEARACPERCAHIAGPVGEETFSCNEAMCSLPPLPPLAAHSCSTRRRSICLCNGLRTTEVGRVENKNQGRYAGMRPQGRHPQNPSKGLAGHEARRAEASTPGPGTAHLP